MHNAQFRLHNNDVLTMQQFPEDNSVDEYSQMIYATKPFDKTLKRRFIRQIDKESLGTIIQYSNGGGHAEFLVPGEIKHAMSNKSRQVHSEDVLLQRNFVE